MMRTNGEPPPAHNYEAGISESPEPFGKRVISTCIKKITGKVRKLLPANSVAQEQEYSFEKVLTTTFPLNPLITSLESYEEIIHNYDRCYAYIDYLRRNTPIISKTSPSLIEVEKRERIGVKIKEFMAVINTYKNIIEDEENIRYKAERQEAIAKEQCRQNSKIRPKGKTQGKRSSPKIGSTLRV